MYENQRQTINTIKIYLCTWIILSTDVKEMKQKISDFHIRQEHRKKGENAKEQL